MEAGLFNITSATTTTLVSKNSSSGADTINIANTHSENSVYISLYLDDDTNQTYYFKKRLIHPGESEFMNEGLNFNNSVLGLKLTTELPGWQPTANAVSVNVIIS